jgi:RimJ/RimL family protein N-acetyltransferase
MGIQRYEVEWTADMHLRVSEPTPAEVRALAAALAVHYNEPVNGVHVGDCDFRGVEGDHAEFAILVGPRGAQAKGLGTRFTLMAHALAFGPLGLARVYISVRPENAGSLRMFEKVGYAVDASAEGRGYAEAEDDVCLSMGRSDFERIHAGVLVKLTIRSR